MYFRDVVGQEKAKQLLIKEARDGRVAHARLFYGREGVGKLTLAIAYARYLSCENANEQDACGKCHSCIKYDKMVHPDLHFVFPVIKKKSKDTVSDDYLAEWRELLNKTSYINMNMWLEKMGAENQQAQIFVKESDEITRKLNLKSSQGKYKIVIIWMPEKMNIECSNKLLKLLEEPPTQTIFLLISEQPDMLLSTILSRTQRFHLNNIEDSKIAEKLTNEYGIDEQDAVDIAHRSEGNYLKALESIHLHEDNIYFLEQFISLMRLSYQRKIKELKQWSETIATMGRERQKLFLSYSQRMIRENFIYNFQESSLSYLNHDEENFSKRFAPFINERNVIDIIDELNYAQKHIEQNVNARMVFFDLSLKIIVLLVRK